MISALEAMQMQAESNQKHIERADESYMDLGKIAIFNVGPVQHVISLGGLGMFSVPTCPEGRIYSEPLEVWKMTPEGQNVDMNKIAERLVNGWGIAEAIVGYGQFMHKSSDMRRVGIFTCGGFITVRRKDGTEETMLASAEKPYLKQNPGAKVVNQRQVTKPAIQAARKNGDTRPEEEIAQDILHANLPTEAEIDEATRNLHVYCSDLVNEANEHFRNNDLKEIQPLHRWAGNFTGQLELPWMKTTLIMTKCAICGNPLLPNVAICMGCDTIQPGKEAQIIAARVPKYQYLWDPSHPAYRAPVTEAAPVVDPPKAHGKGKQS
jgi:hypothetical protein